VGDKIGRFNVYILTAFMSTLFTLAIWIPAANNATRMAFAVLFGFASGAFVALVPALIAQITPHDRIGTATGLIFAICSIGALVASPIAGAIIKSQNGEYWGLKLLGGVLCAIGAVCFTISRSQKVGWKLWVKF
jgi:MFS family permease